MTRTNFQTAHGVVLAAIALLALLLWPGAGGDLLFWLYQLTLLAVLVAGQEFRQSHSVPGPDGQWTRADRARLGIVQGTFFLALMLVVGADGAQAAPAGWLVAALAGGLVFAALAGLTRVFGPMRDAEQIAGYDTATDSLARPWNRTRLYAMPVIILGIAPMLVFPGGVLAQELGIPIYLFLAVAVSEPAPRFLRHQDAEARALWSVERHLMLRMVPVIVLGVLIWQRM
jgi:hypothetical protein